MVRRVWWLSSVGARPGCGTNLKTSWYQLKTSWYKNCYLSSGFFDTVLGLGGFGGGARSRRGDASLWGCVRLQHVQLAVQSHTTTWYKLLKHPGTNFKRPSTNLKRDMYSPVYLVPSLGEEGLVAARDREVPRPLSGDVFACSMSSSCSDLCRALAFRVWCGGGWVRGVGRKVWGLGIGVYG